MERDTFIITAAQIKGHSMPFLLHASKRHLLQAGMSRKDRQVMEEALLWRLAPGFAEHALNLSWVC
jgi:hypothetical protein